MFLEKKKPLVRINFGSCTLNWTRHVKLWYTSAFPFYSLFTINVKWLNWNDYLQFKNYIFQRVFLTFCFPHDVTH